MLSHSGVVRAPSEPPALLPDALREAGRDSRQGGGVFCGTTRTSYCDIDRLSDVLGTALLEAGVRPGDRVVSALPNSIDFVISCFAVWKTGGVLVLADAGIRPDNLERIISDAEPAAFIVDLRLGGQIETMLQVAGTRRPVFVSGGASERSEGGLVRSLETVLSAKRSQPLCPPTHRPDDVVSITYTSGSTGAPKGVMHTHESWLASAEFTRRHTAMTEDDRIVLPVPLHHGLAFRQILAGMLANSTILIAYDIYDGLRLVREQRATALVLVPAACNIALDHFAAILKNADEFLRYVEIGAAAMSPERLEQLRGLLPTTPIHLPYGLTEARVGYLGPGSNGRHNRLIAISPGLDLWLADAVGRPVVSGEAGQIVLRGRGLMRGYWRRPPAEHEALKRAGFFTGDLGRLTPSGHVELLGRLDDMLKVGGRKVSPLEIEAVLNQHPTVAEAVVVGLADPKAIFENEVHAFVVLKDQAPSVTVAELLRHCRMRLETYKVPAQIHFRPSLPKSPVGKVLRHALRPDAHQTGAPAR